jgi:hypothetical protein
MKIMNIPSEEQLYSDVVIRSPLEHPAHGNRAPELLSD